MPFAMLRMRRTVATTGSSSRPSGPGFSAVHGFLIEANSARLSSSVDRPPLSVSFPGARPRPSKRNAAIFGGSWKALKWQLWKEGRIRIEDEAIKKIVENFSKGYPGISALYEVDKVMLGENLGGESADGRSVLSSCVDPYGRVRAIEVPKEVVPYFRNGTWRQLPFEMDYEIKKKLLHAFHVAANTPTQSCNATDTLWMLALLYGGEYVDLAVPPMWERDGVLYPEAKGWALNEGPGPGGKPFQAWHINTVHDSGWGDGAPGYMEATAKLVTRRCTAVPLDWRLEADVPYRIELKVGPDMADLRSYNKVAKEFGLEPVADK